MKVAFFTDSWKPNKDGVVYSIESLIKNLPGEGVEVARIVTPSPDGKERKYEDSGVEVWELSSFPLPFYKQYRFGIIWKKKAKEALNGVDILHSHGVGATSLASVLAAEELSMPSVVTFHTNIMRATHYLGVFKPLGDWFTRNYLRLLYSKFDAVVAPSRKAAEELKSINVDAKVIPNGIDVEKFKVRRAPSKKPLLIHVGRVVKEKNLDYIIEVFKKLREEMPLAELWIVGDGPYLSNLKTKAKDEEGIKFTGWIDREELKSIYRKADALVFASAFDTQGLVVLEAMAARVPVVAHKESSAAEFIDGCGASFEDSKTFVAAVKKVLRMRCSPKFQGIDEKKTAREYAKLYKVLANSKS